MIIKTRKKIFWVLFASFILVGGFLVMHSFGYRLNAKELEFVQTGGLYLETTPRITDIYLDGEIIKEKSGFLNSGIFLSGLIPKNYEINISKDKYFLWKKNLEIKPSLVSGLSHVVILPKEVNKDLFYEAGDNEKIFDFIKLNNDLFGLEIISKENGLSWQILKIIDSNGEQQELFRKRFFSSKQMGLLKNLSFNNNNSQVIISLTDLGKNKFYIWSKSDSEDLIYFNDVLVKYFPSEIKKIDFHPFNKGQFIIQSENRLAIFDLNKKEVSYLSAEKLVDAKISNSHIFWVENLGLVYSYNLISKNTSFLGEIEEGNLEGRISILNSSNSQYLAMLLNDGMLVLFSDDKVKFISDRVIDFKFSPDNKKLAYMMEGVDGKIDLLVYFLKEITSDIEKEPGDESVFNLNYLKNDDLRFVWFDDSYHLIFANSDGLTQFLEIDDRDNVNIFNYQFESGGFVLNGDGDIFRVNADLVEDINLLVPNIDKDVDE